MSSSEIPNVHVGFVEESNDKSENPTYALEVELETKAEPIENSKLPIMQHSSCHFVSQADDGPIKIIGPHNEEIFPEDIVVAPDGGWGWAIVFAAFISNVIVDGTIFSFGILLDAIVKSKSNMVPAGTLGWVGGILVGFYLSTGPFVSATANLFGFRLTAMAGSFVSFFGLTMAWLFNREAVKNGPNVEALFIFYGFIGGVGLCLMYVPSLVIVGFYFEKRRALATGIAVCGSGCGTFIYAPIVASLINQFGWPKTIFIEACLLLSFTLFVTLYRPLKPVKRAVPISGSTATVEDVNPTNKWVHSQTIFLAQPGDAHVIVRVKGGEMIDMSTTSRSLVSTTPSIGVDEGGNRGSNTGDSTTKLYQSSQENGYSVTPSDATLASAVNKKGMASVPNIQSSQSSAQNLIPTSMSHADKDSGDVYVLPLPSVAVLVTASGHRQAGIVSSSIPNPTMSNHSGKTTAPTVTLLVDGLDANYVESRVFRVASKNTLNQPLFRSHIFYSGSLDKIPEKAKNNFPNVEWEAAAVPVTLPLEDIPFEKSTKPKCRCRFTILKMLLDMTLLKSVTFLLFALSGGIAFLAFFVPFMYLQGIAVENNVELRHATALIAFIGIANTLGRVICGFLADKLIKHVLFINNMALTIGGLGTLLVPFIESYECFVAYAFIFGLSAACYVSLQSILIVELIGLSKLTNAMGLLLMFQGLAAFIGSPLAAYIKECTGDFDLSFHVAGSLMVLSGVMCYPLHIINRWEKKRNKESFERSHRSQA